MAISQVRGFVGLSSFAVSSRISPSQAPVSCACSARCVIRNSPALRLKVATPSSPSALFGFLSSSITETRLLGSQMNILNLGTGRGGALGATCSLSASPETLRWIFVAAASVLMFIRNTGIQKQYLVPLLAVELPNEALRWIKGDFGLWTALLALLVKLLYHIPGELELPLYVLLLVICAPLQLLQYRGSTPSIVATLILAGYLSYLHFKSVGGVKGAFESEKIIPTLAVIALVIIPTLCFVNGVYI